MLKAIDQTKQTFFETYARTVINEGCISFMIKTLNLAKKEKGNKIEAYKN